MYRKISLVLLILVGIGIYGDSFRFFSDLVSSVITQGKERTLLKGNAKIITEDIIIEADNIEIYGKDYRFAQCEGNVKVIDEKKGFIIQSDQLYYDREEKISKITGNAVMEDQKNEMIVKGSYLENRDEDDLTIIQVGVRILKEDLTTRSEFALYRREQEILELSGFPIVIWKGDEYRASRIHINLETDEITLFGDVEGKVIQEEKEEEIPVEEEVNEQQNATDPDNQQTEEGESLGNRDTSG